MFEQELKQLLDKYKKGIIAVPYIATDGRIRVRIDFFDVKDEKDVRVEEEKK